MKIGYKTTIEKTIFKTDNLQFPELIRQQDDIEVIWEIGFKCNGGYALLQIEDEDYLSKLESMYFDYGGNELEPFKLLPKSIQDIIELDSETNMFKLKKC